MQRTYVSGAIWSVAEGWVNQALQLLIFMVLARYLAPAEIGLAGTAILVSQLVQNVVVGSIHPPLVRESGADPLLDSTGFWLGAGLGLATLLVLLITAPWIESAFGMAGLASLLRLLAVGGLCAGLGVAFQARLMRLFAFRLLAVRTLLGTLAGGISGVALAIGGAGVMSLAAQFVVAAVVGLVVLVLGSPWRPGWRWDMAAARRLMRFGGHVSATSLVNFFNENADVLIVGHVLGAGPAGVYFIGKRAVSAANSLLSGALSRVALPAFSQSLEDPVAGARLFVRAAGSSALVTTPAFVGLAIIAPEFIVLAFGPEWQGAVPVMRWLCLFGVLQSLGLYNHAVLLAHGKPQWQTRLTGAYAVANLIVLFLVVRYGIAAVAAAYVARAYLFYPVSIALVMRLLPVSLRAYLRASAPAFFAAAVMAIGLVFVRSACDALPAALRLAVMIGSGALLYLGALLPVIGRATRASLARLILQREPRAKLGTLL